MKSTEDKTCTEGVSESSYRNEDFERPRLRPRSNRPLTQMSVLVDATVTHVTSVYYGVPLLETFVPASKVDHKT